MEIRNRSRVLNRRRSLIVEGLESRQLLAFGVTQYPLAASSNSSNALVTGPDGNLWIAENTSNAIGVFNPTTQTVANFPLPAGYQSPDSIISGPSGDLWFTNVTTVGYLSALASINPTTHVITEYQDSNTTFYPTDGIAVDANGNIWAANLLNSLIEFNPSTSAFTTFTTPTADSGVYGVTEGPAGSIWFTENEAHQVGTININTDAITEYPITGLSPETITLGPDGNLWYSLAHTSSSPTAPYGIGTFNPTTHVSTTLATAGYPASIASGPGNNLIYTENSDLNANIIDPSTMAITQVLLPSETPASYPAAVATGPNGTAWYLKYTNNDITGSIGEVKQLADANIVLTAAPNPSMFGTPVTFTATLTAAAGNIVPTGSVTFLDGTTAIGTSPINSSGVATFTTSSLAISSYHPISVQYLGDTVFGQATSNVVYQVVTVISTTTTLAVSPNPSTFGQSVSFNSTVQDTSGNPVTGGTVLFYPYPIPPETYPLGTALVVNGKASFTYLPPSPGSRSYVAVFSPNYDGVSEPTLGGSTSNVVDVSIARLPTSLELTSSANPQTTGQPITFTATFPQIVPTSYPTGTVTFYDGTTPIGAQPISGSGSTLTVPQLGPGPHPITAVYSGDNNYAPSTSPVLYQDINWVPATITTVYATPNPVPFGTAYRITVAVTFAPGPIPIAAAQSSPETVSLYRDGNLLGTAALNAQSQAVFSYISSGVIGTSTFTATYSGSDNSEPSTSAPIYVNFAAPDGPHVTLITTNGNHASTKTLVVYFNEPLYPQTSQDVNNYQITTTNGRSRVYVNRAIFNPLIDSVTLSLRSAVALNGRYSLTIIGTGLKGVTDANGLLLDGDFRGIPGANFTTPLTFKNIFVAAKLPATARVAHKK